MLYGVVLAAPKAPRKKIGIGKFFEYTLEPLHLPPLSASTGKIFQIRRWIKPIYLILALCDIFKDKYTCRALGAAKYSSNQGRIWEIFPGGAQGGARAPGEGGCSKIFLNTKIFAMPSAPRKQPNIPYFSLFVVYLLINFSKKRQFFPKLSIHNVNLCKTVV